MKHLHTLLWSLCLLPPTLNTHGLDGLQSSFMLLNSLIFMGTKTYPLRRFKSPYLFQRNKDKNGAAFLSCCVFLFPLNCPRHLFRVGSLGQRLSLSLCLFQWLECSWMPNYNDMDYGMMPSVNFDKFRTDPSYFKNLYKIDGQYFREYAVELVLSCYSIGLIILSL